MLPSPNPRIVELPPPHAWRISRGASTSKWNIVAEPRAGEHVSLGEAAPNVRYHKSAETVLVAPEALQDALPGHGAAKAAVNIAPHEPRTRS